MPHTLTLCYVADATNIHVQRLLGYFVNRGHRVYCLSDKQGSIDGATVIELPYAEDSTHKPKKTALARARAQKIKQAIREIEPDLVHTIFLHQRGWAAALSGFHPLIVTLLGPDVYLPKQNYARKMARVRDHMLNALTLKQADLVTAVSDDLCKAANRMGMGLVPVELIPIGTEPDLFRPDLDTVALREKLNIPADSFVVLSPRQIMPRYNQTTIIESIPRVLEEVPNAIFLMKDAFGSSPERQAHVESLKQLAESLGVNQAIRWVNEVPMSELPYYYALCDVVVSVPSVDGMPVTIFEAMATQKPLIVGDLASYNEVIIHGQTGLRVPVRNSQVLSRAIIKMHQKPDLAKRMVEEAQVALQQYGIFNEQMMRMERYYHGLLNRELPCRNPIGQAINRLFMQAVMALT